MATTRVSSKGQVIIPKAVRDALNVTPGTELEVEQHPEGVLLKIIAPSKRYTIDDLYGFLKYHGPPKTIKDMKKGIDLMMRERWERKKG
jgi:AbrB family looped-hinge helix DNA binding protein